jgi:TIR domain
MAFQLSDFVGFETSMPPKIFISYSSERPKPTQEVVSLLEAAGYQTFWDTRNLTAGEAFRKVISRELDAADAVIVIWSPESVNSDWVYSEADHADHRGVLITLRTDDVNIRDIPIPFGQRETKLVDDHAAILAAVLRVAGPASPPSKDQPKQTSPKPKWIWWSTRESIEQEIPSVTAIAETLLVVPFYWWLAFHFQTYGFLIFSACIAPLVLLRSPKSVALGLTWFTKWEDKCFADGEPTKKWKDFSFKEIVLRLVLILALMLVCLAVMIRFPDYGIFAIIAFLGGLVGFPIGPSIVPAGKVWTKLGLVPALTGASIVVIPLIVIADKFISHLPSFLVGAVATIAGVVGAGVSIGVGIFVIALAMRMAATLRYFVPGWFSISGNFRRLVFCTSPLQTPELIPGLPTTSYFTPTIWIERLNQRKPGQDPGVRVGIIFAMIIWFVPGWLYRITLKSTVWIWWPLVFIASPSKLAMTPAWQYHAMFRTLIISAAISIASYTNWVDVFSGFISQPSEEPVIKSLVYLLTLDRSSHFWSVFVLIGPILSIVTLIWLRQTFAKYKIAREYKYEGLQRQAERTFPIIELAQRVQSVLFILYCFLLIGQIAIYFNSQKCWTPIPQSVQSWSAWMFGEKLPKRNPKCELGQGH